MKNRCKLCGKSLSQGAKKANMKYCTDCTAKAAALLQNYIVELLEPDSNYEYGLFVELFMQAAEMLHYLPELRGLVGAEKRRPS